MKVAICYSGHIRGYDIFRQCFNLLKHNIVENNKECEFDYFMHTWTNLSWSGPTIDTGIPSWENADILTDISEIRNILDIKNIIIEDQIESEEDLTKYIPGPGHTHVGSNGNAVYNMFYSIYKANELKNLSENKYDCVIRIRPDLGIDSLINLSTMNMNNFNIVNSGITYDTNKNNDFSMFPDFFCASTSKNMDIYSSIFKNFMNLLNITRTIRAEGLVYKQLILSGIKTDFINFDYHLLRSYNIKTKIFKGSVLGVNSNW